MRVLEASHLPLAYTGLWYRDSTTAFELGHWVDGHPEGPELRWGPQGIEAQWHRVPRLPFAESTLHGPTWRWSIEGRPVHDALFEHYLCLRQQAFDSSGEPRPSRRYAMPEPWNLRSARQSPRRDVAYWNDDGTLGYGPLHDPGRPPGLPDELLDPRRHSPEALVERFAPLTRRAAWRAPAAIREHLEALEAALDASPDDLEAWAVLADAWTEAGHPDGPVSNLIITILREQDVEASLEAAAELGPVEPWAQRVAERAWARGDGPGVEQAVATFGVSLSPENQRRIQTLVDESETTPADALSALSQLGRDPPDPSPWSAALVGEEVALTLQGHHTLVLPRHERPSPREVVAVSDRVLRRYHSFVPQGSIRGFGRR